MQNPLETTADDMTDEAHGRPPGDGSSDPSTVHDGDAAKPRGAAGGTHSPVAAPAPVVVVADDDELVAEIVAAILQRDGLETVCVFDGTAAVDAVEELHADALVLDIHMPKKSGLEVLRILKRSDSPHVPRILVLTAQAGRGMEELARGFGADDFLSKPFDPFVLAQRMRSLLGREDS
jgi:CheY-like chemotaxis protein